MKAPTSVFPPRKWKPTMTEYHAAPEWGSSMLKTFRTSPGLAFQKYIAKTIVDEPSPAMIRGTILHTLLLEPEKFEDEVVVVPVRGKTAKLYKDAVQRHPNKLVVVEPELEDAQAMADSVNNPRTTAAELAKALLSGGEIEYSFRWNEEVLGEELGLKVRFDYLTETKKGLAMINLKSSAAPTPDDFARQAYNLGYPQQQAFYERGFHHLMGREPIALMIVIGNQPPHEVIVYQAGEEFLEVGRRAVSADLETLAVTIGKGQDRMSWSAPYEREIVTLQVPPWGRLEREYVSDNF